MSDNDMEGIDLNSGSSDKSNVDTGVNVGTGDTPRGGDIVGFLKSGRFIDIDREETLEGIKSAIEDLDDGEFSYPESRQGRPDPADKIIDYLERLFTLKLEIEEQRASVVRGTTTQSGRSNAAEVNKGSMRRHFEVFYDVNTASSPLIVDVSSDGGTWKSFTELTIPSGGETDVAQGDTVYPYVRAYFDTSVQDTEVNKIEVISAGGY